MDKQDRADDQGNAHYDLKLGYASSHQYALDAVKAAFRKFVGLLPEDGLLVVSADDANAIECAAAARCRVERYRVETAGLHGGDGAGHAEQVDRVEWIARTTGSSW